VRKAPRIYLNTLARYPRPEERDLITKGRYASLFEGDRKHFSIRMDELNVLRDILSKAEMLCLIVLGEGGGLNSLCSCRHSPRCGKDNPEISFGNRPSWQKLS